MANSALLTKLATIKKQVAQKVFKSLVKVGVRRRQSDGTFAATTMVDAKIEGYNSRSIAADTGDLQDARHKVTLYDVTVETDDFLEWGGERHKVLQVRGLLANTDGDRYVTEAVVN